jgi:FlaA1/EpsC-like NDP-sugar epimerase
MIPLDPRSLAAFAHDVAAAAVAWAAGFWLRFNLDVPPLYLQTMTSTLAWVVPLQAGAFLAFGLYRGIWRYASVPDVKRILLASGTSVAAVALVIVFFHVPNVPRSVLVMDPLLLVLFMAGSRLGYRVWKEGSRAMVDPGGRKPALVLGAGDAGAALVRNLATSAEWRVVGVLDDNPVKQRREIHGVGVLGPIDSVAARAAASDAKYAIIAMPGASHAARRRAVQLCSDAGVEVLTVPSYEDIVSGRVTVSSIRHVELDDLLGRDPVQLDSEGLRGWLGGLTVLVTGAGGSIGSELCRQVARFQPGTLVFVEQSEFALYRAVEEFADVFPGVRTAPVIADVKNEARMTQVLAQWRPAVVFHAAAYKHVPLMEELNAWEAVQNNISGTLALARACAAAGVGKFVLVSTDKAVNPVNVMGATKRLAERVCASIDASGTRFVTVRFGNVIGSAGSVVPKFREQISRGGPVTITHPDIERYFMSIPEAAQLVLQAGLMGKGGEIFVLDMGEPVKIVDLARDLIRLSGLSENDVRIEFVGLRPGEKLYEEPLADNEGTLPTPHPKLRVAQAQAGFSPGEWAALLGWLALPAPGTAAEVRHGLARFIAEYRPAPSTGACADA